jgi:hypothetical protein
MLRKRFFAPPTAALLAVALGLGGALVATSAASAEGLADDTSVASAPAEENSPTEPDVSEIPPATSEEILVDLATKEVPVENEAAGPIIEGVVGPAASKQTAVARSVPTPPMVFESLAYVYKKVDPALPADFRNSGHQTLVFSERGKQDFLSPENLLLPAGVCGPLWAMQLDVIRYAEGTFTAPMTIRQQTTPFSSAGVLVKANHVNLPACPPEAPVLDCITAVWSMPAWVNPRTPSFTPFQTLVASYPAACFTLDVPVPDICGTQYQVDNYVNNAVTANLLVGGKLFAPNNPPESFPAGHTGWNAPKAVWKLVKNADCALATAEIAVSPPSCFSTSTLAEERFVVSLGVTWEVAPPGAEALSYEVTFTAPVGSLFADGTSTLVVSGELEAALDGEVCVLPVTDAAIAVTVPDCLVGESLDTEKFLFDPELAQLAGPPVVNEDGSFTVVFTAIGAQTTFDQSPSLVRPGRVVSDNGKTVTFTGTLIGPNAESCTPLSIVDPFEILDTCSEASFTLFFVEGLRYEVTINEEEPFAAISGLGGMAQTSTVSQGDRVRATPVAEPGYVLDAVQPVPLDHQFTVFAADACELPTPAFPEDSELPTLAFTGDSELPTLAFTGASEQTGVAGLIALLLALTGVVLLAAQRRARV